MLKDANSTWLIATQLLSARASVNVPIHFKIILGSIPVVKYTDLKCHRECLHMCVHHKTTQLTQSIVLIITQMACWVINNHSGWLHSATLLPPSPSQVSLTISELSMNGIIQCHLYLSSLAQYHMVFTHGAAGINRSSSSLLCSILLYDYIKFLYSFSADRLWGGFQFGVITKKAAVSFVHVFSGHLQSQRRHPLPQFHHGRKFPFCSILFDCFRYRNYASLILSHRRFRKEESY